MQIADEQSLSIEEVTDLVTVMDQPDTAENVAIETRGFRHGRQGMIAERDNGTQHRYAAADYPVTNLAAPGVTIVGGYTVYDKDTGEDCEFVVGYDTANNTRIFVYDTKWVELTSVITAQVDTIGGTPGMLFATIKNVQKDGRAYTLASGELDGCIAKNASHASGGCYSYALIGSNVGLTINAAGQIPLDLWGSEWMANDNLTFYQSGAMKNFIAGNGTSPQLSWIETQAQRKLMLAYGNSLAPPTMNYPLRIMRRGQRKYFYTGAATSLVTYPLNAGDRWYVEDGGGLITDYHDFGNLVDLLGHVWTMNDWLKIEFQHTKSDYATNPNVYMWHYITVMYGHQESDPVLHWLISFNQVSDIQTSLKFTINPGLMPKDVTGFRLWKARKVVDASLPLATIAELAQVSDEEYVLQKTIPITSYVAGQTWEIMDPHDSSVPYAVTYNIKGTVTDSFLTEAEADDNILTTLNRALNLNRAGIKPRYLARAGRAQGTIIAADKSDNSALFTIINGDLVHEEDNFVDRATDNQGTPQKAFLNGKGEMLGMGMLTEDLLVFRRGEIEVFDLQSGNLQVIPSDVVSKRSILPVPSPRGIAWAGTSGLYFLPEDGGGQQLLNPAWINFYNGDLKIPGTTTPYMTDAQRSAIITGYNPFYGELFFHMNVNKAGGGTENLCFRFNLEHKRWWCVRKFNIGASNEAVKYFSSRKDKTLTIGYGAGLLKYPIQSGALQYEDDVTYAGVSAGRGIESALKLELGSLYSMIKKNVLTKLKVDHDGTSVNGTGAYNLDFYVNGETTGFLANPKGIPIDSKCKSRTIRRRGRVESVQVYVSLPIASLTNFQDFSISTITVSFTKRNMIGRR